MRFRFILSHEIEGSLEITEPSAWKDCVLKLERHEEFHSLIEYFDGSFIFYGNNGEVNGGIDFIKLVERNHGVDATILIDIDLTFDEITFLPVFNGQFKLSDLEEMPNNKMRLPIIRDDFWAKFIARLDTPVDLRSTLNLDDEAVTPNENVILKLTPQKVKQVYSAKYESGYMFVDPGDDYTDDYIQFSPTEVILDEIEETFTLGNAVNPEVPVWILELTYLGEYTFDLRIEASKATVVTLPDNLNGFVTLYFQINDQAPIAFTQADHGGGGTAESTVYTYSDVHVLAAGTVVRIYGQVDSPLLGANNFYIWGEVNPDVYSFFEPPIPSGEDNPSRFYIEGHTIFPQSSHPGFLVHDVGAAITDRTIGVPDTFYSELLGSTLTRARQYEEDGCAWTYAVAKGLQLRQYTLDEKPFFLSFNQFWKGINPILNLSLSYDTVDDVPVIRVEHNGYVFDNTSTSINLSNIRQITRKYDNEKIHNKVDIGYVRWESENISGIDDPQSKKTYSTRFKKVGKPIQIYSEWIAASLAIEQTRRTTREKSADYKYDNETFIIAINPTTQEESPDISPDLYHFIPELDENFSVVTNLLNAETRYNLRLTPARNFLRWQDSLQGALQDYIGSEFKFASGQGNYDMTSTMDAGGCLADDFEGNNLSEKGNIPVTNDFLHLALLYEMEIPIEWEDYILIRNNRRKPIGISQTDTGHVPMFIKTLEYKPVKGTCTILAWAKEFLDLSQVPDTTPMLECYPSAAECEDALTDEFGEILTDELGVCITE